MLHTFGMKLSKLFSFTFQNVWSFAIVCITIFTPATRAAVLRLWGDVCWVCICSRYWLHIYPPVLGFCKSEHDFSACALRLDLALYSHPKEKEMEGGGFKFLSQGNRTAKPGA